MRAEPEYLSFGPDAVGEVTAVMDSITEAHSGWINFEPVVEPELLPAEGSPMFSVFSARGPAVPLGTWTPPSVPRRGRPEPAMIGLQHPAGTRAKSRLADCGHAVPQGWVVTQDHARKGLVVALPPDVVHADVVTWLIGAATTLCAIPLRGGWRAAVFAGNERSERPD